MRISVIWLVFANEGYVVLAVDLYGGEVTETSDRARELATTVRENPETAVSNMQSAVSFLRNLPNVEKKKSLLLVGVLVDSNR